MSRIDIVRECAIARTPRVVQIEGMFDLESEGNKGRLVWHVDFDLPEKWNVGVIVGPSGAGKSTIASEIFGDAVHNGFV